MLVLACGAGGEADVGIVGEVEAGVAGSALVVEIAKAAVALESAGEAVHSDVVDTHRSPMAGLGTVTCVVGHVREVTKGASLKIASMIEQIGLISANSVAPATSSETFALHTGISTRSAYSLGLCYVAGVAKGRFIANESGHPVGRLRAGCVAHVVGTI